MEWKKIKENLISKNISVINNKNEKIGKLKSKSKSKNKSKNKRRNKSIKKHRKYY